MLDQIAQTDRAAANLLHHCAGLNTGDRLVILHEPPGLGYYDDALPGNLAQSAMALGLHVQLLQVPFAPDVRQLAPGLAALIADADCAVFIARLGDQLRFQDMPDKTRCVVVYALDGRMFRSPFGTAHYGAFLALKAVVDSALDTAREIRVTCPLGSDFGGPGPKVLRSGVTDVSILRFPMSVFSPVPAQAFSGCVALRFLAGTGSRYYLPGDVEFERPLIARFEAGRLTGFDGSSADMMRAKAHYAHVAGLFGIDAGFVHSWHAGIHPGCTSTRTARSDYDRWSGSAFGNPRLLHFHTCGSYAPGEISWNVIDPTIRLDGVAVWENGRLYPERLPGGAAILEQFPCAAELFTHPSREIGV